MFVSNFGYKKFIFLMAVISTFCLKVHAAKRYWISSATANWNSTANWSSTSGGGSGSSVPGSNDTCYFDGNGLGRCDINANVNVKRFEIVSTYTDTITQNAYTITVGSTGMVLAGGVFIGSSSAITVSSSFSNSACNFKSTSGTFEIKEGHFSLTGTGAFIHNNGLVKLFHGAITSNDTSRITLSTSSSDKEFYDMQFDVALNYSRYHKFPSGALRINHLMTISGSGNKYIGVGTIELLGDYTHAAGFVGGGGIAAGTLKFMGTGSQYLTCGSSTDVSKVTHIDINKASGTLYLVGSVVSTFDLKLTSGSLEAGTSRFYYRNFGGGTKVTGNFTGSNSLNKLYFIAADNGSLTLDDTLQVKDSVVFNRSTGINKGTNAGVINAKGSVTIASGSPVSGTLTLLMSGSGTQVYKSGLIYDLNRYIGSPNLKIQKSGSDTLKLIGFHPIQSTFTYVSGLLHSSGGRVKFSARNYPTITGSLSLHNVEFCYGSSSSSDPITIASGTQLTVLDTLLSTGTTSASSNTLNTGIINLKGNMYITSTSPNNAGSATIKINGTADQHIYGYTGSGTLGRLPHVEIDKSSGTLYLHNTICTGSSGTASNFTHTAGTINYGTSTLVFANNCNITSAISGNRLDLYNVQFTTGTVGINASTTLVANGNFSTSVSSSALTINGGTMELKGNITINNTHTNIASVGTASLVINGSSNQTFTGSGISAAGYVPKITIDKPSGTLFLASIISAGHDWTYTAGTVDASTYTSKVYFAGTRNLDAQGTGSTMSFYDATFAGIRTLTGDLNIKNNLVINASSTLAQSTYGLGFGGYTNNGTHSGSGAVTMVGNGFNTFSKSGGGTTSLANVTINRSGGSLTLVSPLTITNSLVLSKGVVKTTAANLLKFADNATSSGGSDSSYIHGPVTKKGNDEFIFPLGDTSVTGSGKYHPLKISAPSDTAAVFSATYFAAGQTLGSAVDSLQIGNLNNCEYWTVSRDVGTSQVKVGVNWNTGSCRMSPNAEDMRLAQWNGTKWISVGDVIAANTVTSNTNLATFGSFALAQNVCAFQQQSSPFKISANVIQKTDAATNNGSIALAVSGGTSPYTYSWSSGPVVPSISGLTAGIYSITVTDAINCQIKKYYFIGSKGATTTYTLTADALAGKDATTILGPDGVTGLGSNYGTFKNVEASYATDASVYYKRRSFLQFDFSSLPLNTMVNTATLNLYGINTNLSASGNESLLKRVGDKWEEDLLTWGNQPYVYDTDPITLSATTNTNQNYSVDVLSHVQKMVANPYGNNGWMLQLAVENPSSQAALRFASSDHATSGLHPGIVINITIPPDCDLTRNWVQTTTFGEEGEITSQSKSFMDNLGRGTQDQARILSNGTILASQTMYDGFGRPVGSTLPAPTYTNTLCYKTNFITDGSANPYDYNNFDKPVTGSNVSGEVNNPAAVGNSAQGTVGWYYSNNNGSEPFVAATSYPYSRVEYTNDPTGTVRKAGGVDDMFKMGSGHETKSFTMPSAGELDYLYGYRGTYNLAEDFTPVGQQKSENLLLYKTLSMNADGKEAISYSNSSGQLIASCVSGAGGTCALQDIIQPIRYVEKGYTTLHIPANQNNSVELPLYCAVCPVNNPSLIGGNYGFNALVGDAPGDIRIYYKFQNAETSDFLIENTDYTLNRTTRKLTFINSYANRSLVLNVAYDVPAVYKTPALTAAPPELSIAYKLDYNQWSLNYYDLKGRLISSVAPNDINCTDYFQGSTSNVENYKNGYYYLNCITSLNTTGRSFNTRPSDYAIAGREQSVAITIFPSYEDPGINTRYINPPDTINFEKTFPKASFGRFADTTAVIDTNTYKTHSLEWLTNNLSSSLVPLAYEDSIIVLDSLGSPIDTLIDSTITRLFAVGKYMEFEISADIGYKATSGGNFIYQGQNQVFRFRLAYDYDQQEMAIMEDPDNTINYFVPQSDVDQLVDIGIKFKDRSVRFVGYAGINSGTKFNLCANTYPGSASGITTSQWNTILFNYSANLKINYKAVINNYYTDAVAQTPTTKISYDKYNRVVKTISQDEGQSDVIYDDEGKLRFTQNDLQRSGVSYGGRFSYVNYDKRGRPVESGEYDPTLSNGAVTKMYFQTQAQYDASTNTAPGGSTSLITVINSADGMDNPRKKFKSGVIYDFPQGDVPSVSGASPVYTQRNAHGRVSKAWNENSSTWYSYDERGGLTWTVQTINDLGNKTYNYVTSLFGQLQQTRYQKESSTERLYHKYEYDADGRLVRSYASTDAGTTWNPLTKNEFYTHGPLKRTELGHKLQGIDYVYTVGGALKSINDPYLTEADPGADGFTGDHSAVNPDVFGYSIDYYPDDYKRNGTGIQTYNSSNFGGDNDSYAGIIKSVRWRTTLPAGATNNYGTSTLMYEYNYDFNYQLTDAMFTPVVHNSGSVPSNTVQPATYHDPGHGQYSNAYATGSITYDLNGNIQTLSRNPYVALDAGVSPSDALTYHYSSTLKNRLLYVSDAAGTGTGTETDFPHQSNTANYTYDAIGQLIGDVKDNLKYEYYPDGLVKYVRNKTSNDAKVRFEYNHLGLRQRKTTYDGSGEPVTYTWYVYDPGGALVSTYITPVSTGITTQEDLPLYAGGRVGMLNKSTGRYAFELTDHLGNVRSVIAKNASTSAADILSYSDYYPHGGVLPGRNFVSSPSYKMGYQGQEKDAETNFSNFELRQLDPRLGRWFNPDPMGQYYSPYLAMGNNPVSMIDPSGGYAENGSNDGGMTDYNGYSYEDPFFARDKQRAANADYSNSAENYQNQLDNRESNQIDYSSFINYKRTNYNSETGEWGHWKDGPRAKYEGDGYNPGKVWVANPAEAMAAVNAAYMNPFISDYRISKLTDDPIAEKDLPKFIEDNFGVAIKKLYKVMPEIVIDDDYVEKNGSGPSTRAITMPKDENDPSKGTKIYLHSQDLRDGGKYLALVLDHELTHGWHYDKGIFLLWRKTFNKSVAVAISELGAYSSSRAIIPKLWPGTNSIPEMNFRDELLDKVGEMYKENSDILLNYLKYH